MIQRGTPPAVPFPRQALLAGALGMLFVASPGSALAAEEAKEGYKVGEFRVVPNASVTERWDDNIYGQNTGEVDDTITNVSASVAANSEWTQHRLGLEAGVSADYYADNDTEDTVDWWIGGDGRRDLSVKSHVTGGIRFSQNHEDRSSPDAFTGAADPTTYVTSHAHLGFSHRMAPFTLRLGGVYEDLNFTDGSAPGFDINQRDRAQYSLGMRFSYQRQDALEVFFQALTDTREYEDQTVGRDSDGYRMGLGLRTASNPAVQAEGFVGYLSQDYDNVTLKDVNGLYYGANLKWKPAESTQVTGYVDRAVNETTLAGASSHLDTTVGARIDRVITPKLSLNATLAYSNSDYQGVSLELDEFVAGIGARYYFDRCCYLAGGYRFTNRDANNPTYEYDKNVLFLSIGYSPRGR